MNKPDHVIETAKRYSILSMTGKAKVIEPRSGESNLTMKEQLEIFEPRSGDIIKE
jgi:hypothetical protein